MAGGGWRQAGVIAAPALIALREGPKRLHEDHANAKAFAAALATGGEFDADPDAFATNIIMFALPAASPIDPAALLRDWRDAGVLANHLGRGRFRAVTHLDVSRDQVVRAARIMTAAAQERRKGAVHV